MFDFDIGKLLVVAIVALAVIPPKDLPRVMRTVGQVLGRMRRMAAEFQGQFMDAMREAEFDSVRKELAELNEKATAANFDPAKMIRDEVTKAAEPVRTAESATAPAELAPPPAEPMTHIPAPSAEGAEIGASEVVLTAADPEPAPEPLAAPEAKPAKSSAAE